MHNRYDGVLQFKGKWRTYQQRVLNSAQTHLADHKVHIVAAPGSGKTTLGIELIRRLGAPCLVLSPSITIRQQWLERISTGFLLPGNAADDLLSNDLRQMRDITAITYQALYSAMKPKGQTAQTQEEEPEDAEEDTVDYTDFDIFSAIKTAGVRTICLDEAHHLRSEWWKALEAFMGQLTDMTVIALTATPPYDSTPAQWKRYIDLCGPIDEEIFTPELVQEGSLCPHEDYIYFNWPVAKELEQLKSHQEQVKRLREQFLMDEQLKTIVASHRGLQLPEECSDMLLENPAYFSSLLIFCQAQKINFSPYLKELIGTKGRLPQLDDRWLQLLLQGLLFEDTQSYDITPQQRLLYVQQLREGGCIYRNKVVLTQSEALQKLLVKSQGKLESIGKIVQAEHRSMQDKLRLLVLCDYIKADALPVVGTDRPIKEEIGAVPIFEYLRRQQWQKIRLGCLSGSVVILPMEGKASAEQLLAERGCQGTLTPIPNTNYGRLQVKGKSTHIVAVVTQLFTQGIINVLVGTKSLLGEGWDAPCINTLVLATYVGSFMLSNQMRGRTIRVDQSQPDKTGNIWHLACVFPQKSENSSGADLSGDYENLVRRFESFLGVSWTEDTIESGIGRLGIPPFNSQKEMENVNQLMLQRAMDRKGLCDRWKKSLTQIHGDMEIERVEAVPKEEVKPGYVFFHALGMEILSILLAVLLAFGRVTIANSSNLQLFAVGVCVIILAALIGKYGVKLLLFSTPQRRMDQIGRALLRALVEIGEIEEPNHCKTQVDSADGLVIATWLKGGTMRDKTTFAACMEEIWGIIDNPRYLLARRGRLNTGSEYYSVPEVFGRQKERALIFERHMKKVLGSHCLVYTRCPEGRKVLLRARTRSFVNKNQSVLCGKKVAKGKYE